MELEPMDEFEENLRQAFERKPAPPGLKRRLMEQRRAKRPASRHIVWLRLAAVFLLATGLAGGGVWRSAQQRRKGEAARVQVLTALRITGHALDHMNQQLAAHGRASNK